MPNTNLTIGFNRQQQLVVSHRHGLDQTFRTGIDQRRAGIAPATGNAIHRPQYERELRHYVSLGHVADQRHARAPKAAWTRSSLSTTAARCEPRSGIIPSRSECLACHTPQGGLGARLQHGAIEQDRSTMALGPENQIAALSQAGYFSSAVTNVHTLRSLAAARRLRASASNIASAPTSRPIAFNAINRAVPPPPPGTRASPRSTAQRGHRQRRARQRRRQYEQPGDQTRDRWRIRCCLQRISTRGPGQMPPLDSTIVDTQAVALVSAWITNDLPAYQTFADWQIAFFNSTNAPQCRRRRRSRWRRREKQPRVPDRDRADQLRSMPGDISIARSNGTAQIIFPANRQSRFRSAKRRSTVELP